MQILHPFAGSIQQYSEAISCVGSGIQTLGGSPEGLEGAEGN